MKEEKYKNLLSKLVKLEPSKGLESKILLRIAAEEKKAAKANAVYSWAGTATSLGLSIWAGIYLAKSFKESGFWEYFSLLISENAAIAGYWKELSFSLAESMPILGMMAMLSSLALLIWSLSKALKNRSGLNLIFA